MAPLLCSQFRAGPHPSAQSCQMAWKPKLSTGPNFIPRPLTLGETDAKMNFVLATTVRARLAVLLEPYSNRNVADWPSPFPFSAAMVFRSTPNKRTTAVNGRIRDRNWAPLRLELCLQPQTPKAVNVQSCAKHCADRDRPRTHIGRSFASMSSRRGGRCFPP